jgi:hypothetical protein
VVVAVVVRLPQETLRGEPVAAVAAVVRLLGRQMALQIQVVAVARRVRLVVLVLSFFLSQLQTILELQQVHQQSPHQVQIQF